MKNFFLTFSLAVLVVLAGVSVRKSVAGIGGSPMPHPPKGAVAVMGIGGSPMPHPPKGAAAVMGIGGSPMPHPPASPAA